MEIAREDMKKRAHLCAQLADDIEFNKLNGAPRPLPLSPKEDGA